MSITRHASQPSIVSDKAGIRRPAPLVMRAGMGRPLRNFDTSRIEPRAGCRRMGGGEGRASRPCRPAGRPPGHHVASPIPLRPGALVRLCASYRMLPAPDPALAPFSRRRQMHWAGSLDLPPLCPCVSALSSAGRPQRRWRNIPVPIPLHAGECGMQGTEQKAAPAPMRRVGRRDGADGGGGSCSPQQSAAARLPAAPGRP